jgi:SnoaL-like domain
VTEQATPADLTVAFTRAWSSGDMDTVGRLIAEDIAFESPMVQLSGVGPYLEAVGQFAQLVSEVNIIAVMGEKDRSIIMYDMKTGPFGTLRAAEHFVFENGKIKSDQLVFDTHEVRKAARDI